MAKTSTRDLGRFVRRDRQRGRRRLRPSRAWLSSVATQALAQALGTLPAAGILILGAAAVGQIHGLSTRALISIAIAIVALGALLIAFLRAQAASMLASCSRRSASSGSASRGYWPARPVSC